MTALRNSLTSLRLSLRLVWAADKRSMTLITAGQVVAAIAAVVSLVGLRELVALLDAGETSVARLAWPAALLLGATALTSIFAIVIAEVRLVANDAVERMTSLRVLEAVNRATAADFEDAAFHDLLQRASHRASTRAWAAVWASITIVTSFVTAAAISTALLVVAPIVFFVAVVAAAPGFLIARRNSRLLYEVNYQRTSDDRRRLTIESLLRGRRYAPEVRTLGANKQLLGRVERLYDERLERSRDVAKKRTRSGVLAALVGALLASSALFVLVFQLASGDLSLANGLTALVALQQVGARARSIAAAASDLDEAGLYLRDHDQFVREAMAKPETVGTELPVGTIVVREMSFRYSGANTEAVTKVDLEIGRGEFVAVVGENGSGKTTLSKVVAGLYEPTNGSVEWAGQSASAADRLASTRCVFQDYARFPLTLRENITLGLDPAPDSETFEQIIEAAGLKAIVDNLANGSDTLLAREFDDGVELSGGQWQRVAIARALAVESSLLILDEPSAALDPRQERDLVDRLRTAAKGRSVLFISHRFSTVRDADRIVVMKEGEIVEVGPHEELIEAKGLYAELFTLQAERYL